MPTETIGDTTTSSGAWQGTIRAWQIVASASGTLTSVGINVNSVGTGSNTWLAIYTDVAGVAGVLLGQSADTVGVVGWNDLPIPGISIVKGTAYWIGFQAANNQLNVFRTTAGGSIMYSVSQSYGSFPASPVWSLNTGQNIVNLRMAYTETGGPVFGLDAQAPQVLNRRTLRVI